MASSDLPLAFIYLPCLHKSYLHRDAFTYVLFQNINFQATEQEYEREKLNERIAKLSGGVAVIQVTLILNLSYLPV